jgi:hypothetical protein
MCNKNRDFRPFKNESDCVQIGDDLTIENRVDRVSIFGSIDITLDKEGLLKAKYLKDIIDSVLVEMEATDIPDKVKLRPVEIVENPFLK